jgi:hypothetical protein
MDTRLRANATSSHVSIYRARLPFGFLDLEGHLAGWWLKFRVGTGIGILSPVCTGIMPHALEIGFERIIAGFKVAIICPIQQGEIVNSLLQ